MGVKYAEAYAGAYNGFSYGLKYPCIIHGFVKQDSTVPKNLLNRFVHFIGL